MKRGDTIRCLDGGNYNLTPGREYTVLRYEPRFQDALFAWPAYVHLKDNSGLPITAYARRFEVVE